MGEGDQGQEVNFAFVSPWSLVKGSAYAVTKPQQEARRVRACAFLASGLPRLD